MRIARAFVSLVLASSLAACSAAPTSDNASTESSALRGPLRFPVFVTATADANGGWDVAEVNGGRESAHGVQLDFSATGLAATTVSTLEALPTTELLLEGTFQPGAFAVSTAYEGMPGIAYDATATFYEAGGSLARALDVGGGAPFTSVDVSAASAPWVQQSWLTNEVTNGALVAGQISDAGVLAAAQIFLALPFASASCAAPSPSCEGATLPTYTRDANLCLDFQGCEKRGLCPFFIPFCEAGYVLVSWAGTDGACPNYACDPAFIH